MLGNLLAAIRNPRQANYVRGDENRPRNAAHARAVIDVCRTVDFDRAGYVRLRDIVAQSNRAAADDIDAKVSRWVANIVAAAGV